MNAIELYQTENGETKIEVKFDKDTVWLSLNQMSTLFGRDKSVISRHLRKIFETEELYKNTVVAKNATTATDGKIYKVEFYNLDVIIAIGYRVNSKQGTLFRIWATKRLKEYLVEGFSINRKRIEELNYLIQVIEKSQEYSDSKGLLNILKTYTKSFILLNQYDSNTISIGCLEEKIVYEIKYTEAVNAISKLKAQLIIKKEATELFGNQKDQSFEGILKSITQTFEGKYLYPTIEEQAAHLLYFVIKSHPFSDGNKRIGALLFIWFLQKNKYLLKQSGENKINDNALTALALLVAQSNPNEKELMIKLICNLINN